MDDFEEIEFNPPAASRVAARALVLCATVCRASLEGHSQEVEAETLRQQILEWIDAVGLQSELEDAERQLLAAPLGTLDERVVIDATWNGEAMGVLAWALGRYELPPYDQIVSSPSIGEAIGFLEEYGDTALAAARLRSSSEIDRFRERMFALHWRLREFSLRRGTIDLEEFASKCGFGPLDISALELVRRDLAIDGRSLLDVSEERWHECLSIASERHRAANWLAGYESVYSEVTADT